MQSEFEVLDKLLIFIKSHLLLIRINIEVEIIAEKHHYKNNKF